MKLFLPDGEAKYFCERGWTAELQNSPAGKSVKARCRVHHVAARMRAG
jgi:hypothetical protein